jgi:hypothetical protein
VGLGRPVGLLAGVLIGRSVNIDVALRATPELSYRPYVTKNVRHVKSNHVGNVITRKGTEFLGSLNFGSHWSQIAHSLNLCERQALARFYNTSVQRLAFS